MLPRRKRVPYVDHQLGTVVGELETEVPDLYVQDWGAFRVFRDVKEYLRRVVSGVLENVRVERLNDHGGAVHFHFVGRTTLCRLQDKEGLVSQDQLDVLQRQGRCVLCCLAMEKKEFIFVLL